MTYATIPEAITALQQGNFIIAVDDAGRENEGDLILAAEFVTEEKIAFMINHTSGILCLPLTKQRCQKLKLSRMVEQNSDRFNTPFTVSVDAKNSISSGVSAGDRCTTIKMVISSTASADDLVKPGHVFPLEAADDGVLERPGHTEAAIDLCKLAGLNLSAVIAEVMDNKGRVMKGASLLQFAYDNLIPLVAIADIIAYRKNQPLVKVERALLPTAYGDFDLIAYEDHNKKTHIALIKGFIEDDHSILVRIHSACLTGDVFQSQRCDCGWQLHASLQRIADEGKGILLYLSQEGRGIGILEKIKSYALQDKGYDTAEANVMLGHKEDERDYTAAAQILKDLGVKWVKLLTNNPQKKSDLEERGIMVTQELLVPPFHERNLFYLKTKKEKFHHALPF